MITVLMIIIEQNKCILYPAAAGQRSSTRSRFQSSDLSRIRHSWVAVMANSPLALYTYPIFIPRPPASLTERMSSSIHSSARKGAWNQMLWSSDVIS